MAGDGRPYPTMAGHGKPWAGGFDKPVVSCEQMEEAPREIKRSVSSTPHSFKISGVIGMPWHSLPVLNLTLVLVALVVAS